MKYRGKSRLPRKIEVVSTSSKLDHVILVGYHLLAYSSPWHLLLFLFIQDIFSRKIVGHEVHKTESMEKSSYLIENICIVENIQRNQIITHADNGNPHEGLYHACNLATTWNCTFVQQTWGQ